MESYLKMAIRNQVEAAKQLRVEKLWRYSINTGELGGVVIADCLEEAYNKVKKKYGDQNKYGNKNEIEVWEFKNDDYYDKDNEDVVECYGI